MGLDMSLYREVETNNMLKPTIRGKLAFEPDEGRRYEMKPVVKQEVCEWRKFNALHKYMRDNFGEEGDDNCVNMYLEADDIEKLLELVKKVKAVAKVKTEKQGDTEVKTITNGAEVAKLLPTEDGFFFGSTEYDDYYLYNIDQTITQLTDVVEGHKRLVEEFAVPEEDITYYYRAWY